MTITGGCYCGAIRYTADGAPMMKAECFCRDCQYISGGNSAWVMAMPSDGFRVTKGITKAYSRADLPHAVSREFCADCGTHVLTRAPAFPAGVILKVGSMDDPSQFGGADFANYASEAQSFHHMPNDIPVFQKWGQ